MSTSELQAPSTAAPSPVASPSPATAPSSSATAASSSATAASPSPATAPIRATAPPDSVSVRGTSGEPARRTFRSDRPADRMMRRLLGVTGKDLRSGQGAHKAFRISVVISALRCVITYVAIPVLIPILSLVGWVAAPVGIALCVVAAINGVVSVRRFWRADHRHRWTYTAFIGVVFVILTVSTITELGRLGVI